MIPVVPFEHVRATWDARGITTDGRATEAARQIIQDVRQRGDAAVFELTARFDGATLQEHRLDDDTWQRLADEVPAELATAMEANLRRIMAFHATQVPKPSSLDVDEGIKAGRRPVPHAVAACYVPGGRASYPSTVLMTVPLARLAGVGRVMVVTPPGPDGRIDPAVALAARLAGATDILRIGGAQAVAAVTWGTQTVPRADVIVGPGNAYVAAAKALVAAEGRIATDAPAGPSELLVIADADADPDPIAWDLLAQAEHDPDAEVVLVTPSMDLAEAVRARMEALLPQQARHHIIAKSLEHARLVVVDDMHEAIAAADLYAPEHLEIHAKDAETLAGLVRNAGSIFIGAHAPVSLGDYGSGTNHVLPTSGLARLRGGLCVADFMKWVTWQTVSPAGLAAVADDITRMAEAEGLEAHAEAVRRRLA